jgi:AAA ATPase domain
MDEEENDGERAQCERGRREHHWAVGRTRVLSPNGHPQRAPAVIAENASDSIERDCRQMGRRHTPTLTASASGGENCGQHNLEVFRPPTSRRWAAVPVSTARASGKVRIPPIRGRADELKVIGALISGVAQRRGGVLVIEGPPGIGKSRMLTEVLALAEKAGVRALFGEAFEYQQAVPFFSLFMATLSADPPVGDVEALRRLGGSADLRYWVVHDLADAIHAAAAQIPLVIVLEDIHWADNGTLLALRSLAVRPDVAVLWVVTARTGAGGAAVQETLSVLQRTNATFLRLAAMTAEAVADMVVLSQRAGRWSWRGGSARFLRWACGGYWRWVAAAAGRRYAAATGPALR